MKRSVARLNSSISPVQSWISMFTMINSFLHRSSASSLPILEPGTDLATEFSQLFENEIIKIHDQLSRGLCADYIPDSVSRPTCRFVAFTPVTPTSLTKIIKKSDIKSCPLDPIPAHLILLYLLLLKC